MTSSPSASPLQHHNHNHILSHNSSPSKTKLHSSLINGQETENGQEERQNPKRIKLSESTENLSHEAPMETELNQKIEPQIIAANNNVANQNPSANGNSASMSASNSSNSANRPTDNDDHPEIDEALYSRQLYVLGHEAMRRMQTSNILISGMGGLGVEIAKNVVLGGVKSVTIHDTENVTYEDLSTQFFLHENDIGKNRAVTTQSLLAELNTYVPVNVLDAKPLSVEHLKSFQVVVLTSSSTEEQLVFGKFCHENDIKFIVAETRGIFGQIFCDFGEKFEVVDVDGEQPLSAMISCITNDPQGIVTTLDEQRHGFEDGMYVTFSEVKGMSEVNEKEFQIKVYGPYTFGIGDTTSFGKYIRGGYVHQVKKPKIMKFKPIEEAVKAPETLISDFTKMEDSNTIHVAFHATYAFMKKHSRLPRPWCQQDSDEFISLARELNDADYKFELNDYVLRLFSSTLRGQISPMHAVIGGTAAQEIMKACSGKFTPIYQYFYFDCREILPEKPFESLNTSECLIEDNNEELRRYKAQIAVLGQKFQRKMGKSKYFIVGAGALGCEYLKNFAMMGMCTKAENGKLIITDMDTIEKSNLNRQFLFRSRDVRQSKSTVASAAALKMNPHINIEAQTNRVGPDTEHVYNDEFFESLDGVCNALDNIDARIYVDRRCVYYHKPLIESGTLGTKGNVQVVKPFLTESYSSTQDPPEKSIPICTLKNFPNAIEHTLQWARDTFEGVFTNPAAAALEYIRNPSVYIDRIMKLQGSQPLEELSHVYNAIVQDRPNSFEDCVKWARLHWQESYHNSIEQLLYNFPRDQLTSSGLPFWSGPKRCPHSLNFSTENPSHVEYVFTGANLKAEMYGIPQVRDRSQVVELVKKISVAEFRPKQGIKIHVNDSEAQNAMSSGSVDKDKLDDMISRLKSVSDLDQIKMSAIEFEKDDDTNLHMDFIVACSNLRAENYDITPADRHKSKLIAGRIIPAIATTTSLIVGLDCIELYKLIQGHDKIELFKSSFVNLALPFFGPAEPAPPKKSKYYENEFSLWDRFEVKGDMTLKEFIDYFKEKHSLEITMLSQGVVMLYSFFMDKKKLAERLNMSMSKVVETVSKKPIPSHVNALVLELCCNDTEGEDLEVPYVKYILPARK
ncbi:ubiquitin-like modifier-activating enzyme 1 [Brachionus plicatilis]|uniref:E1 ubiquitin-activating enzyme n=1 Tax=Brachionus plicatilis TaxID=10195 RepID=A0A3M7P709_BRAPC|nr:ubiquitin-like modifier-activating enzyme 1 [Brachionus plicatilis]